MQKKCYYCGKPATTTEHVPPRCLFPEMRDSGGVDYRNNLLTVPSCDEHNAKKSNDDEYFLFILTCSLDTNAVARNLFLQKVSRAIKRKPNCFSRFVVKPEKILVIEKNMPQESISFNVDEKRYTKMLLHIIKGIYYTEFKKIIPDESIEIVYSSAISINPIWDICLAKYNKSIKGIFNVVPYKGNNPEIFRYKIVSDIRTHIFCMEFYESFVVVGIIREILET